VDGGLIIVKQISAAKFQKQCLALIDTVSKDGIVITKRGKPVAKLIPISSSSSELIGSMKGRLKIRGDILSSGLTWEAER
jgi:prevent-host-death family protein